ncbi:tetratricopeptide repeat protein [Kordia sp.]|uniref:tetratricopeptide repeat protein n=1 Tax=Kordia sp. TaxID=1965332 RepID=UPI003D2785CC
MKTRLCIYLFIISNFINAQTIQKGEVKEINSGGKGIAGVQIVYENALATDSDGNGVFTLSFRDNLKSGDEIFMQKITKKGYELVNRTQLQILKLSSTDSFPEKIILAKHGMIDSIRAVWSGASINALTKSYRRKNKSLKRDLENAEISKKELDKALVKLSEEYEQQQKQIETMADRFARTNFDDVDPIYKKALQKFKEGKIDSTIILLESINIIDRISVGVSEKKKAEKYIKDNLRIARDLGDVYSVNFNKSKAIKLYGDIYKIDSMNLSILEAVAIFYEKQNLYERAIFQRKNIINHFNVPFLLMAESKWSLALLYRKVGKLEYAHKTLDEAKILFENLMKKFSNLRMIKNIIGLIYQSKGTVYEEQGDLNKAFSQFKIYSDFVLSECDNFFEEETCQDQLAASSEFLGRIEYKRGNWEKSKLYFSQFRDIEKRLYEKYPKKILYKGAYVSSLIFLGDLAYREGEFLEARELFLTAQRLTEELIRDFPEKVFFKDTLGNIFIKLGNIELKLGNLKKATDFYLKDNVIIKKLSIDFSNNNNYKRNLGISYFHLGKVEYERGHFSQAKENFLKYRNVVFDLKKRFPDIVKHKEEFANSNKYLGDVAIEEGNLSEAHEFYNTYNILSSELNQKYPNTPSYKDHLAISYQLLGIIYNKKNNLEKAFKNYLKFNQLESELHADFPENPDFKYSLACSYQLLGEVKKNENKINEASNYFRFSNTLLTELNLEFFGHVDFKYGLAVSYQSLGFCAQKVGDLNQAFNYFLKFNTLLKVLHENFSKNPKYENGLAISYQFLGKIEVLKTEYKLALNYYNKYNSIMKGLCENFPLSLEYKKNLASSYLKLGMTEVLNDNMENANKCFEDLIKVNLEILKNHESNDEVRNSIANDCSTIIKLQVLLQKKDEALNYYYKCKDIIDISSSSMMQRNFLKSFKSSRDLYLLYKIIAEVMHNENASPNEVVKIQTKVAWHGILSGKFKEAELILKESLNIVNDGKYVYSILPLAILLQNNDFGEAKQLYLKLKDKPFGELGHKTYKDAFLSDIEMFEKAGIIPDEVKQDVEKIKEFLKE